jgi:hypothetical protein
VDQVNLEAVRNLADPLERARRAGDAITQLHDAVAELAVLRRAALEELLAGEPGGPLAMASRRRLCVGGPGPPRRSRAACGTDNTDGGPAPPPPARGR